MILVNSQLYQLLQTGSTLLIIVNSQLYQLLQKKLTLLIIVNSLSQKKPVICPDLSMVDTKNELGYNYLTNTSASHRKMKNTVSKKYFLALFKTKEVIIEECIFFSDSTCNRKGYRLGKQSSLSQSKFIYIEQRY